MQATRESSLHLHSDSKVLSCGRAELFYLPWFWLVNEAMKEMLWKKVDYISSVAAELLT